MSTGMLSSSPAIPDDDIDTDRAAMAAGRAVQDVDRRPRATSRARSTRTRPSSRCDDGFASRIEPADTDKDAFIVAHPGAAEYINDDTKSFMDRYSDLLYLAVARAQHHRLDLRRLYAKVTRVAPEKASELATAISRHRRADRTCQLDATRSTALQDELEAILRGVVIGLRDGTISSDGLDTFKLGYEFVRRRDRLMRRELTSGMRDCPWTAAPAAATPPMRTMWWW